MIRVTHALARDFFFSFLACGLSALSWVWFIIFKLLMLSFRFVYADNCVITVICLLLLLVLWASEKKKKKKTSDFERKRKALFFSICVNIFVKLQCSWVLQKGPLSGAKEKKILSLSLSLSGIIPGYNCRQFFKKKKKSAGKKYNKKNRRQNPDLVLHIYASL